MLQPVPIASCGHPPDWTMSGVPKVGQDYRMWLGGCRHVPHGHSSEWEFQSVDGERGVDNVQQRPNFLQASILVQSPLVR